jgi:hypothetical protein
LLDFESLLDALDSLLDSLEDPSVDEDDALSADSPPLDLPLLPLADAAEADRESVMYQPLPLNTMPTG